MYNDTFSNINYFRIDFEGLEDDIYKSLVDDYNYYLESLNELEKTLEAEAYAKINELKENIDQILEEHEEENLSAEDITKLLKERGFTDFEILTFNVDNSSTDLIDDNPEIFDEIEIDFDIEKEDKKEDDNDNSRP